MLRIMRRRKGATRRQATGSPPGRDLVRPPGFEFPDHRLRSGLPGRWVGNPLDASGYVLDQARLRPHKRGGRQAGFFYLTLDFSLLLEKLGGILLSFFEGNVKRGLPVQTNHPVSSVS